jgi:hypothetical protein
MRALSSAQAPPKPRSPASKCAAPRGGALAGGNRAQAQVADEHQKPAERAEQAVLLKSLQIHENPSSFNS